MAAENEAVIVLTVNDRSLSQSLNKSKGRFRKFTVQVKRQFSGLRRVLRTGLAIGGIAGVGGLIAAGKQVIDFEAKLTRLQINAQKTATYMGGFRQELFAVAKETGTDPDELLGAAAKYQEKTGELDTFRRMLGAVNMASLATGTTMENTALLSAELSRQFGIKTQGDMIRAFDILQSQASKGAVELRDLATLAAGIAPTFVKGFGRKGLGGLQELGALLQVAEKGFGDASEASTGLRNAMVEIFKAETKLKKAGIDTKKLGLAETIFAINKKSGGGFAAIRKLLGGRGNQSAIRTIQQFGKEGQKAFRGLNEEGLGAGRTVKDFKTQQDSAAASIGRAKARMKEAFNKAVVENIDSIASAIEGVGKAFSFMAENKEIIALIASLITLAKVAKGLAGIGGLLMTAGASAGAGAAGAAAGQAAGGAVAGGFVAKGALLMKGGAILGAGLVGYLAGKKLDDIFGLSDKAVGGVKGPVRAGGGGLDASRKLARAEQIRIDVAKQRRAALVGGDSVSLGAGVQQEFDIEKQLAIARRLEKEARESARQFHDIGTDERFVGRAAPQESKLDKAYVAEQQRRAKLNQELAAQRSRQKQQVEVLVRVEDNGKLSALLNETQTIRRRN